MNDDDIIIPEDLKIPQEFLNENKLIKTSQKPKGGPYTKNERFLRRQEVFNLHFERGISATKIAEDMQVNRNTINDDINFWWSKLKKELDYHSVESLVMRQLKRLESQRTRLMTYLENESDTASKLSIERLLLDIDNRISQIFINTKHSSDQMIESSVKLLNQWARQLKWGKLPLRKTDLVFVAEEDYDDISKRVEESRVKTRNKGTPLV